MSLTASDTTRALRKIVYPLLKKEGFDDWTSRKTWRRSGVRVDHVEFRSFNSYFADTLNCTPASVSVWIGLQIPELKIEHELRAGLSGARPHEAEMPIRGALSPSLGLRQRNDLNIWNIKSNEDAEASAADISLQFETYALDWLNSLFDVSSLISFLRDSETENIQTRPNGARFWLSVGNPDSPNRNSMIAKLAISRGDYALAARHFERSRWALNQKTGQRYLYLSPEHDADVRRVAEECAAKGHSPRS